MAGKKPRVLNNPSGRIGGLSRIGDHAQNIIESLIVVDEDGQIPLFPNTNGETLISPESTDHLNPETGKPNKGRHDRARRERMKRLQDQTR